MWACGSLVYVCMQMFVFILCVCIYMHVCDAYVSMCQSEYMDVCRYICTYTCKHKHYMYEYICISKRKLCKIIKIMPLPPNLPPTERLRERVIVLVGKSYSAIRLEELSSLLGHSEDQSRHSKLEFHTHSQCL